jgi:hypothetical protein
MTRALSGHTSLAFSTPGGITFAEIDPDTGFLAGPTCPRSLNEAFLPGTVPSTVCPYHGF